MERKRALVTGAGKRLGRDMALALAEDGYDVAVHYGSSADDARAVVDAIAQRGGSAVALDCDLSDEAASAALIGRAADALNGPILVLINNASHFVNDQFADASRDAWDQHMATNLRAPYVLTQALANQIPDPVLDENGEPVAQGSVINMGDHWAWRLAPEFASYAIAKSGVEGLTRIAATALAGRVRVNAICPGPTVRGVRQSPAHFSAQRDAIITGRGSNPQDILRTMRFILNSPAITGQSFMVDGGLHLGWAPPRG